MSLRRSKQTPVKLEAAGIYGYEDIESVILASLVTADPLLLIGNCGTGKTFLLNSPSEALGLEHRHYNASLISFDDLVGFPFPAAEGSRIEYLQTPATVWGAESVLIDEISRCKPEHQNRLFSLVQERRVQGIKLDKLIYRWAAMNPCGLEQNGDSYEGSEPLDQALADRFAFVVEVPDWDEMSDKTHRAIACADEQTERPGFSSALRSQLESWRTAYSCMTARPDDRTVDYCLIVANELGRAGFRISPRRVRQLVKNIAALLAVRGNRREEKSFEMALTWSLPQRAWGVQISEHVIRSAHRTAWDSASLSGKQKWLNEFHLERRFPAKINRLVTGCPDPDTGTLAVTQLLANESKERAALFAYAVYPAALAGALNIGSEGVSDLGKAATAVIDVDWELKWKESQADANGRNRDWVRLQKLLDPMSGKRRERAAQLYNYLYINDMSPDDPVAVEEELNECVTYLSSLGL
ncbi:MAG: AAA family ATPase [Acidobacteria bacterium]|nr:AAA family ATPase [Acidobacteriota bacterium]